MIRKVLPAALLIVLCCSPAVAQLLAGVHLFPVIARVAGTDGSNWVTDLTLSNAGGEVMLVTGVYYPEGQEGTLIPLPANTQVVLLQAGETLTVRDVLSEWFPTHDDGKGALVLYAGSDFGGDDVTLLGANARIYNNADPEYTFGQTAASGLLHVMLANGRSVLPGMRWDDRVRSNVGVANVSLRELTMLITVYAADGSRLVEARRTVPSLSMQQWSLGQLGVGDMNAAGRVDVVIDPATVDWDPCAPDPEDVGTVGGAFIAYASRVDRNSNDAEFLLAQNDWSDADCTR